jgi:hypothetical protein
MARGFGTTDGAASTDAVTTVYAANHTTISFLIHAYRTGAGGGNLGRLFNKGANTPQFYHDSANSRYVLDIAWSGGTGSWSIPENAATAWAVFLITYDGSSASNDPVIYINGVSQTVTELAAPSGTISTTAENYVIGNRSDGIRVWNGRLAEFAIWSRVLTAVEIANLSQGTRADVIATPVTYWRLLGNDSPEPNYILGGSDGTVTGTVKQTHPTAVGIVAAGVVESLRTDTSDPMTWSHNQGTTGPKGVLVGIMHGTSDTDHVSTVTYGTKSLARVQRNTDAATEPGAAEWWFATGSIPTGTQTVTADLASGTTDDILGVSITLDADADLEVLDVDGIDGNTANPSVTMNVASRYAMAFAAFYSGLTAHTSITAGTGSKKITTQELSGNFTAVATRQIVTNRADFAMACTSVTDDVAYAAVAVTQVVANTTVTPGVLALTLTTYAPTVTVTNNVQVTPGVLALTLTTYAPVVTVSDNKVMTPDPLALTLTTFAPTVTIAPVAGDVTVTPDTAALTITTYAPTVTISDNKIMTPDTLALTLATYAPAVTVSDHKIMTPDPAALTLSTYAPTVTISDNKEMTPDTLALTLTTYAPTVTIAPDSGPIVVTPDVCELSITSYPPTVTVTIDVPGPSVDWQGGGAGYPVRRKRRRRQDELFAELERTIRAQVFGEEESQPIPILAQAQAITQPLGPTLAELIQAAGDSAELLQRVDRLKADLRRAQIDYALLLDEEEWMLWV